MSSIVKKMRYVHDKMKNKKLLIIMLAALLLLPVVFAQLDLPPGLVKLLELQNQQVAALNFLVVLAGGVLALMSPCVISIVPAFLLVMFKEKKNITKSFGIFLLGVSFVFALFALGGLGIGRFLRLHRFEMALFVGLIFLAWSVFIISGKSIPFLKRDKHGNDVWGTFGFGILFAIGYTPCTFAIPAAISVIGNTPAGSISAAMLTFTYIVGLFLPMMVLALLYDHFKLSKAKWMQDNMISIGKMKVAVPNLIAGAALIFFGLLFVLYRGTYAFNSIDPAQSMVLVSRGQGWLLGTGLSSTVGNILGLAVLLLLGYGFYRFVKKHQ